MKMMPLSARSQSKIAAAAPSGKGVFDKRFITPFLVTTKKVITTMAGIELAAQKPEIINSNNMMGQIVSVMPMAAPEVEGHLTISFMTSALLEITSKMIMEECTEVDQLVLDTAAELTNMVAGGAKVMLEKINFDFNMTRPLVYQSEQFGDICYSGASKIRVPYLVSSGAFFVELSFVHK